MIKNNVTIAGLDTKEGVAFISILELGEATMGQLVKKSQLKRTTLYDIIDVLKSRRLVSVTKRGKKTLYIPENPHRLLDSLDEQRSSLEKLMPELLSITNNIVNKPKVRYFEGVEGIKEVYRDVLRYPDQKMQSWVPENIIDELDKVFFEDFFTPGRLRKRIWAEVIASDLPQIRHYKKFDESSLRKIKLVNADRFPFSVEICLYGRNHIGIMSYKDQMGLIIESESIAKTLQSIFNLQWELLADH
jgi:sugar-specific transcriptional regulator TrmB